MGEWNYTQNFLNLDIISRPSDSHTGRFNSVREDPIIYRTVGWEDLKVSPSALEKKCYLSFVANRNAVPHKYIYKDLK
jgi:hypothetical protein